MDWALAQPIDDDSARIVLIVIANHINKASGEAFPSRDAIAKTARKSLSTVKRKLKWLADNGFLIIESRQHENGRTMTHAYRMAMGEGVTAMDPREGVTAMNRGGGHSCEPGRGSLLTPPIKINLESNLESNRRKKGGMKLETGSGASSTAEATPDATPDAEEMRKRVGAMVAGLARTMRASKPKTRAAR